MKQPGFPQLRTSGRERNLRLCGLLFTLSILLLGGCDGDTPSKPTRSAGDVVPDFKVLDVNPNSSTYGDSISPREYLGQISCWYFGHAT